LSAVNGESDIPVAKRIPDRLVANVANVEDNSNRLSSQVPRLLQSQIA
jgi:hypothetical protein